MCRLGNNTYYITALELLPASDACIEYSILYYNNLKRDYIYNYQKQTRNNIPMHLFLSGWGSQPSGQEHLQLSGVLTHLLTSGVQRDRLIFITIWGLMIGVAHTRCHVVGQFFATTQQFILKNVKVSESIIIVKKINKINVATTFRMFLYSCIYFLKKSRTDETCRIERQDRNNLD